MNEFPASNSEFVYCYHGHEIPILSDDFGNNYVPIKSLKCLGIKFYDTAPDVTNKLAFDKWAFSFPFYLNIFIQSNVLAVN